MFNLEANASQLVKITKKAVGSVVGLKKEIKRKQRVSQAEQMKIQVKKVLGQKEQGLIVMVRG